MNNLEAFVNFQYRHFLGHSSAMGASQFSILRNDFNEIQKRSNTLTCFKIFSRALAIFMLTYVPGVPPVQGRLIQIKGLTSLSNEFAYSAIFVLVVNLIQIKFLCEVQYLTPFRPFAVCLTQFGFRMAIDFNDQSLGVGLGSGPRPCSAVRGLEALVPPPRLPKLSGVFWSWSE